MQGLLSWAGPGTELLVGLTDPLDAAAEAVLVPGRLELDPDQRPVVVFVPPWGDRLEAADARRLGEDWGAVHLAASGEGLALWVFAPGSPGHLRWQIRQAQRRLHSLLADGPVAEAAASRRVAALAGELHQLVCRAALLAAPAARPDRAAPGAGPEPAQRLPAA